METLITVVYGVVYVKSHPPNAYFKLREGKAKDRMEEEKRRKVLIINTGGTIGSKYTDKGIVSLVRNEVSKFSYLMRS